MANFIAFEWNNIKWIKMSHPQIRWIDIFTHQVVFFIKGDDSSLESESHDIFMIFGSWGHDGFGH